MMRLTPFLPRSATHSDEDGPDPHGGSQPRRCGRSAGGFLLHGTAHDRIGECDRGR